MVQNSDDSNIIKHIIKTGTEDFFVSTWNYTGFHDCDCQLFSLYAIGTELTSFSIKVLKINLSPITENQALIWESIKVVEFTVGEDFIVFLIECNSDVFVYKIMECNKELIQAFLKFDSEKLYFYHGYI